MNICILSDSHDNRESLAKVMKQADEFGAEHILHCGDVVAPNTLRTIITHQIPLHVIHGNNTGDLVTYAKLATEQNNLISYYGRDADINLAGKRIFLVHYPHYAEAMAITGRYHLVCCGHSHLAKIHYVSNIKGGNTPVVNPGNTAGIRQSPHFVLGNLEKMQFKIHKLD